jgi:hypothetical protein
MNFWRSPLQCQRKSDNWEGFKQLLDQVGVVKPHIVGRPRRDSMVLTGITDSMP